MKKLLLPVLLAVAAFLALTQRDDRSIPQVAGPRDSIAILGSPTNSHSSIERAFDQQQSNVQVQASGTVEKILRDDNDGSRHQRFILRLSSGHTILIAHNIDLAPRVSPLREGDAIELSGEYEWNNKGGVVHWTHRDPQGRHAAGWIRREGSVFE